MVRSPPHTGLLTIGDKMSEFDLLGASSIIALGSLMALVAIKLELRSRRAVMRGIPSAAICACTHYAWEHDYYRGSCQYRAQFSRKIVMGCICEGFRQPQLFTIPDWDDDA